MIEPLVMVSRRRRKETSWVARPGWVGDEERMFEMRMGRPVRVERIRRCVRYLCPVNRRIGEDDGSGMVDVEN